MRATAEAVEKFADLFTKMGGLMAERVTDLRDIRDRVIAELSGLPEPGVPVPDVPSILCAEDLAPADTAGLDPALIVGLATTLGGPTSHTAIIARQLAIPCVVAIAGLDDVAAGTMVLIDGNRGTVVVSPDAAEAAAAVAAPERRPPRRPRAGRVPAPPSDGQQVSDPGQRAGRRRRPVGRARHPPRASGCSAPNCASSTRETEPTVDEQAQIYGEVLEAFPGRKVVIRTLDAGSDKPLKFAGHPEEANPALGVRGIRIAARQSGAAGPPAGRDRGRGRTDRQPAVGDGADDRDPRRGEELRRQGPRATA